MRRFNLQHHRRKYFSLVILCLEATLQVLFQIAHFTLFALFEKIYLFFGSIHDFYNLAVLLLFVSECNDGRHSLSSYLFRIYFSLGIFGTSLWFLTFHVCGNIG